MTDKECTCKPEYFGTIVVGERGQVVIPKELRDKLGLETGAKLVLLQHQKGFVAIKTDAMKELLKTVVESVEAISKDV